MAIDPKSAHYDAGGIEVAEVIRAKLTPEQYEGFLLGNIIKYSLRCNWKDQKERDIEKIGVYARLLNDPKVPDESVRLTASEIDRRFEKYMESNESVEEYNPC